MLFIASLLGLVAVSASAFVELDDEVSAEDTPATGEAPPPDEEAGSHALPDLFAEAFRSGANESATASGWQIVEGGAEAETITGEDSPEMIHGRDGDDLIAAGGGTDDLRGGAGADALRGGADADTLHGNNGTDRLEGGSGDDRLFGHNGNDSLAGGAGNDSLVGSAGDDALHGGTGDDALHGDLDDDRLQGGPGSDTLFGGHGNDTVSGIVDDPATDAAEDIDSGRDFLNGGGGSDAILAGRGDVVTTGAGTDEVLLGGWLHAAHQAEILDFSAAEDRLVIIYDGAGPPPVITLEPDADTPEDQRLLLDGAEIARIANAAGLTLGHVALLPQTGLAARL